MEKMEITKTKKERIQKSIKTFNPRIKERYNNVETIINIVEIFVAKIPAKNRKYFRLINYFFVPKSYRGTKKYMMFDITFNTNGSIKNIQISEGSSSTSSYGGGESVKLLPIYYQIDLDFDLDSKNEKYDFIFEAIVEKLKKEK